MRIDEFWSIVENCRHGAEALADFNVALTRQLAELPLEEVADFRLKWLAAADGLYSWDVWDASALMLGGTDDDSFLDFRSWVISLGQADYNLIRDDADNLASYGPIVADAESPAAEQIGGIATSLYFARTGRNPPNPPDQAVLAEPFGRRTNLHDLEAVRTRFPRIYAWRTRAVK